jgi:hypothetical protein
MGQYVTAYARDIADDALVGQTVIVGGIVRCFGRWGDGPDYLELADAQGSILVIVPGAWSGGGVKLGTVVLIAGTVERREWPFPVGIRLGHVMRWEQATALGPERFATAAYVACHDSGIAELDPLPGLVE